MAFGDHPVKCPDNRGNAYCPQCCFRVLDGVFLCVVCEEAATRELVKAAERAAWEEHEAERPRFYAGIDMANFGKSILILNVEL